MYTITMKVTPQERELIQMVRKMKSVMPLVPDEDWITEEELQKRIGVKTARQLAHLRKKLFSMDLTAVKFETFGVDKKQRTIRRNFRYDWVKYQKIFKTVI